MRNPLRKAGYCLALGLPAVAGLFLAGPIRDRFGETTSIIIGIVSLNVVVFTFVILLMALFAALGQARLMRGKGVIARWHVSAAEWDRFRAFNAIRSAQDESLLNELRIRDQTPALGVDVLVGRRQIIVDGSYHPLSGIPFLSAIYWLPAPADPECLEFALAYPRGRYGGVRRMSLRVPVPLASREDGIRVYWHYHATTPKHGEGLVFRRPRLVFGWCAAFVAASGAIGGSASLALAKGYQSDLAVVLAMSGVAACFAGLLVIAILVLIVRTQKSRRPTKA